MGGWVGCGRVGGWWVHSRNAGFCVVDRSLPLPRVHLKLALVPPPPHPCQASKLRVKPASIVSRVEVLPPGTFGTGSSRPTAAPSRQLPSGSRNTTQSSRTLPATASTVRRALPSTTGASSQ